MHSVAYDSVSLATCKLHLKLWKWYCILVNWSWSLGFRCCLRR